MQSIIISDSDTGTIYNVIRTDASTDKVERTIRKYIAEHGGEWCVEDLIEDLREHVNVDDTKFSVIHV